PRSGSSRCRSTTTRAASTWAPRSSSRNRSQPRTTSSRLPAAPIPNRSWRAWTPTGPGSPSGSEHAMTQQQGASMSTAPHRTAADGEAGTSAPLVSRRRRTDPLYHLFLSPSLALFTAAVTIPSVLCFAHRFTISIGFGDLVVICLRKYIAMFRAQGILGSCAFTPGFALVTVVLVILLAFALALGLTARIRLVMALR